MAIMLMTSLSQQLVGPAVNHEIGKIINAESDMSADDPKHEKAGANYKFDDPVLDRRILADLLQFSSGMIPLKSGLQAGEALRALDYDEVQPLLEPIPNRRRGKPYTIDLRRLNALEHVAFRRGKGDSRDDAVAEVAAAYGRSDEAIIEWGKSLAKKLGVSTVQKATTDARSYGGMVREFENKPSPPMWADDLIGLADRIYGDEALEQNAAAFKAAVASDRA